MSRYAPKCWPPSAGCVLHSTTFWDLRSRHSSASLQISAELRDAVGCASGTDALWLALVAGWSATRRSGSDHAFQLLCFGQCIVRAGARPVFADIDPRTFNLDPARVEAFSRGSKRDKLRALVPVHLYGQCADMDAFKRLAEDFHLSLIEDAAQAIGARWASEQGRKPAKWDPWGSRRRSAFIPQRISAPTVKLGR
jgi:dTDP-4-amino-4,6-dideoxygalactose transaminase